MQPPHLTYHPPPSLWPYVDSVTAPCGNVSQITFFENRCMLNMILDELLFASRTQTSKWLTLSLQIWRRYYSGGIPGDNRHWSNSLVGDPGKQLACRRNPMQPVAINISHLRPSLKEREIAINIPCLRYDLLLLFIAQPPKNAPQKNCCDNLNQVSENLIFVCEKQWQWW